MEFSARSAAGLTLIISLISGAFVWGNDRPTTATWIYRILTVTGCLSSLSYVAWSYLRRDLAPDYLKAICRQYLNRLGFAFYPQVAVQNGVCNIRLYFQNQRDARCIALVVMYPRHRALADQVVGFQIECGPGEFGSMDFPIGVPDSIQGRNVLFETGATVDFPDGKGSLLRFREGRILEIGHKLDRSILARVAGAASHLAGLGVSAQLPGRVLLKLPSDVAQATARIEPFKTTLWTLGADELPVDWSSHV